VNLAHIAIPTVTAAALHLRVRRVIERNPVTASMSEDDWNDRLDLTTVETNLRIALRDAGVTVEEPRRA